MKSRELVVFSHLRWVFVWQRPQHLIARIATGYDRTWFVEEPVAVADCDAPRLRSEELDHVTRVWLDVPVDDELRGFSAATCAAYLAELPRLIGSEATTTAWLYTPMALDVARALDPTVLVYDVMDDLAAFQFAPTGLVLRQRQALRRADLVFTGGRSLQRGVVDHRNDAHCFPSGVEPEHYAAAVRWRAMRSGEPPTAGYVGVIDERIDLELVAGIAGRLPDWEIRMVGPVVKIDPATLPQAPNITYPGARQYAELPKEMARFDVALMPFALNEATRSISPTKTLEYLAAGLPVVSTRVPDVVSDYAGIVDLRDDADGFAAACAAAIDECDVARAERCAPILRAQHWDTIAARMASLLALAERDGRRTRATA